MLHTLDTLCYVLNMYACCVCRMLYVLLHVFCYMLGMLRTVCAVLRVL